MLFSSFFLDIVKDDKYFLKDLQKKKKKKVDKLEIFSLHISLKLLKCSDIIVIFIAE